MNKNLESKYNGIKSDLDGLWKDLNSEFKNANETLSKELAILKKERDKFKNKFEEAQAKIDHIEKQLESTVKQMEEFSKNQEKDVNALELLDIYLVLMGEVFSAAAHVRLLFILHGDKDEFTLNELSAASGYPALEVRKSVFELRNANIVEFDEDKATVKLINRFM